MRHAHERYKFIRLREDVKPTESEQKAYVERLVPKLLEIVKATNLDWLNKPRAGEVVRLCRPHDAEYRRDDVVIPERLTDLRTLGWQDRRYGSNLDDARELADELMDSIMRSDCRRCFTLEEEDCVAEDLGYFHDYEDEDNTSDLESTACSADDCGYCGRCKY
jgi:hypothetical protein